MGKGVRFLPLKNRAGADIQLELTAKTCYHLFMCT